MTQVGTYNFGIMVDRVFDTEKSSLKPVAPILRHIEMFSNNHPRRRRSVIMILTQRHRRGVRQMGIGDHDATESQAVRVAPMRAGRAAAVPGRAGAPKAVPLALVARLEELGRGDRAVQRSMVVQYRGQLMPAGAARSVAAVPTREAASRAGVLRSRTHDMG